MNAQHVVRLTPEERSELGGLLRRDAAGTFAHRRARILLHADTGVSGPRLTDREIAAAVAVEPRTVGRVRAQFAAEGLAATLRRHARGDRRPRKLDGADEARLVAIACTTPPGGQKRWTLRMLAKRLVELEIVAGISPETVRQTLKKTTSNRG
jgi:transposase